MPHRKLPPVLVVLLLSIVVQGCSALRFGRDEPDLTGTWIGSFDVEGQAVDGSLVLVHEGDDLEATFSAPSMGLSAEGNGTVDGERFTMVLDYNMECPGVARLRGTISEGTSLSGSFQATDCTGTMSGTFSFRPRTGG